MKRLRKWAVPIITCLVVLTVTLLPQGLSRLQDRQLAGRIHAEAMISQNDLPSQPPSLPQRIELLSLWRESEDIFSVEQDLTHSAELDGIEKIVYRELDSLAQSGVMPSYMIPDERYSLAAVMLNLQHGGIGAGFILVDGYAKNKSARLWMILDEASGHALWLEAEHFEVECDAPASPTDIGRTFLDRLGIEHSLLQDGGFEARFSVSQQELVYYVICESTHLQIIPRSAPNNDTITNTQTVG